MAVFKVTRNWACPADNKRSVFHAGCNLTRFTMEDSKLQALHDTLSKLRGSRGLGADRQYSWQKKQKDSQHPQGGDGAVNNANPLYAYFHKEGEYKRGTRSVADDGDGRVIKRNFDDVEESDNDQEEDEDPSETSSDRKRRRKEERKAKKKALRKAEKLEAKRQAKLEEKRRAKRAAREKQKNGAGPASSEAVPSNSSALDFSEGTSLSEDVMEGGSPRKTAGSSASSNEVDAKADEKRKKKEAKKRACQVEESHSSGERSAPQETSSTDKRKEKKEKKKKSKSK